MSNSTKTHYVIFGQLKLKHQRDIVGARMHNMREKNLGNVEADGPPPVVVYGAEDIWAGVLARLGELRIDPRKGAVLALELMFATSPEWWVKDEDAQAIQRAAFERQALKYLRGRFAPEAMISVVWHLDEASPHLHVVVIPVRHRVDARFRDRGARWTLCARGELLPKFDKGADRQAAYAKAWRGGMGGRGHMAFEQTRIAEVMAPLGLKRGKLWSGAPNKTNGQHHAEMAAAIVQAGEREAKASEREAKASELNMAAIMAEADALGERDRYRALSAEVEAKEAALNDRAADVAAQEVEIARQAASLADREAALAAKRATLYERSERAAAWTKAAKAKEARLTADAQRIAAEDRRVWDASAALVGEVMQIERISHLLAGLMTSTDQRAREVSRLAEQLRSRVDAHARDDDGYGNVLRQARAARLMGGGIAV